MAKYHAKEGTFSLASETEYALLRGYTSDLEAAELDGNVQGSDYSDTGAGLKTCTFTGDFFLGDDQAIPDVGVSGALSVVVKDSTTDGTLTGTFVVLRVSLAYRLNNYVAFSATMKNQGAYTLTAPS